MPSLCLLFPEGVLSNLVLLTLPWKAKYVAASKEAVWLRKFLMEPSVVPDMDKPLVMFCDSSGAVSLCKEPRNHKKGNPIERKYHLIQDSILRGEIVVEQISS